MRHKVRIYCPCTVLLVRVGELEGSLGGNLREGQKDVWREVWREGWREGWRESWKESWKEGWNDVWRGGWREGWRDSWMESWRGGFQGRLEGAPLFLSASRCGPMNGSEGPTLGFLPMGVTIGRAPPKRPGGGEEEHGALAL